MALRDALLPSPLDVADEADARRAARLGVYEMLRAAQVDGGPTSEEVAELIEDAERRGWPDVVKLRMYLAYFCDYFFEGGTGMHWIEALLERAERDGDTVMTALALAARAQELTAGGRAQIDSDRDLARATVLLEGFSGASSEAVSAHIECAYAYEFRDLWEMQQRHLEAAEACLDSDEDPTGRHEVLLYNRAELGMTWVAALRERGLSDELAERAEHARRALDDAARHSMPESWRDELHVFRHFIDAVCPPAGEAAPLPDVAEGPYAGFIHLARALRSEDPRVGLEHCERAIELIDPSATNRVHRVHLFALALAVELEAAIAGRQTAAMRWGRELVAHRWERRLAALASIESLVEVERREAEHALLHQHAYLDDLTGLANRRALQRFVEAEQGHGVADVAVAVIDLDRFKTINDTHGHAVGDAVLVRVAEILRAAVREQDLVVRLGGDEFLLVLLVPDEDVARRRGASIATSIAAAAWSEICDEVRARASVGVAYGPLRDFRALTALADEALYRAKQAGGARSAS